MYLLQRIGEFRDPKRCESDIDRFNIRMIQERFLNSIRVCLQEVREHVLKRLLTSRAIEIVEDLERQLGSRFDGKRFLSLSELSDDVRRRLRYLDKRFYILQEMVLSRLDKDLTQSRHVIEIDVKSPFAREI